MINYKGKAPPPCPSPAGRGAVCWINYGIYAVGYIYKKRNVGRESNVPLLLFIYIIYIMPHSRIHVTKTIIDILFMRKALATQL